MLKAKVIAHKLAEPPKSYRGNAHGYGDKIATPHLVQTLVGGRRWRRVWAICWSNVATLYVVIWGKTYIVDEQELEGV